MKKFSFKLESVMNFKNQKLEWEKIEHANALMAVAKEEEKIRGLHIKYKQINGDFNEKKAKGITPLEGNFFLSLLRSVEEEIKKNTVSLEKYKQVEEKKRTKVVETKIETSSLEKIKEKKYGEYLEVVKKSDEIFIEEFVSRQRSYR